MTPFEKLGETLSEEYQKNQYNEDELFSETISLMWAKFIYIQNKLESIDKDEYKDFVELASPLDWMGIDDLTDNGEANK